MRSYTNLPGAIFKNSLPQKHEFPGKLSIRSTQFTFLPRSFWVVLVPNPQCSSWPSPGSSPSISSRSVPAQCDRKPTNWDSGHSNAPPKLTYVTPPKIYLFCFFAGIYVVLQQFCVFLQIFAFWKGVCLEPNPTPAKKTCSLHVSFFCCHTEKTVPSLKKTVSIYNLFFISKKVCL